MWYRIKLGVCDAAAEPVRVDGLVLEGKRLSSLLDQLVQQLEWAWDHTRETVCPGLLGVLHVGLEIQGHRSSKNSAVSASEVEACLRAIQTCAMAALCSGGCSQHPPTRMGPPDYLLN